MSTTDTDIDLEDVLEGDADPEAYNEQKEQEFEERIAQRRAELNEQEQQAADALVDDAKQTVETETVKLDSGLELEVRARIPPRVERMHTQLERLERQAGDLEAAREMNCRMLAEMVETDDYDSPGPWLVASRDGDAGMQWLGEATATILGPALDRLDETKNRFKR